jgi:hypothetical protein
VFLTERWARLKKIRLVTDFPSETVTIESDPFAFAQIVFWCLDVTLSAAQEHTAITVAYSVQDGGAKMVVHSADGVPEEGEIVTRLRALIDYLGGDLRMCSDRDGGGRIEFFIPGERPDGRGDVLGG